MVFVEGLLKQMAETWTRLDVLGVRAVATAAVRDANNQHEFLDRMSQAAGVRVEIISGIEEARLIHLGVQSTWPHPKQRILIVDIGGGSMEIIHSEAGKIRESFSKPLGALRLTGVFLKSDPASARELHRMETYIADRIDSAVRRIGKQKWDRVIGTSATAAALICAINRVPRAKRDNADRLRASGPQVRELYRALAQQDLDGRRKVTGIGARRAEIIVAGAAGLSRVMQEVGAASIYYSSAGVRDGIIADLAARGVGREKSRMSSDQRQAVEQIATHYGVSLKHARKVASLAHSLFIGLQPLHRLPPDAGKLLEAAAYLHDTGHYVSDTRHHKHSYYLVQNSDLAAFTDRERELIATLCRYHRKSMPSALHPQYQSLLAEERRTTLFLVPLLRVADALDRSHEQLLRNINCVSRNGNVIVRLESDADIDLEQWAAERVGDVFQQVYNTPVQFEKVGNGE